MSRHRGLLGLLTTLICVSSGAATVAAQTEGAIAGRVATADGRALGGAEVLVDERLAAVTDTAGVYRARGIRSGWHRVSARIIGYRSVVRDSVFVHAGGTVALDFALPPNPLDLEPIVVTAPLDPVLDPLATASEQKITAADLRDLPVSTLEEALALSAGAVGESYRGGRVGEESFVFDGLGIKNQLDASSGGLGLHVPPDLLGEASLVTNAFSARYGRAISGLVNVVTRDPGDRWRGRLAYESDRPFTGSLDLGLDRFVAQAGGPLGDRIGFVGAIDVTGRLDADPVNAPAPADPLDPRSSRPAPLPHNSGEVWTGAGKVLVHLGQRVDLRLLGLHSEDQRLLFDPAYKYDVEFAPARRVRGDLLAAHLQFASDPRSGRPVIADLRLGRFAREFIRGALEEPADYALGALTGRRFRFLGEDVARAQSATTAPLPGFHAPSLSANTPWGVPAFFLGGAPRGELAWNRFGETRAQLDVTLGGPYGLDLFAGGEVVGQQVDTYQRALGFLRAEGDVPAPAVSAFSPTSASGYVEGQLRLAHLAFTAGVRYDQFSAGSGLAVESRGTRRSISPRFAVSTVLERATLVASFGRFAQAPDYQYLVDAAFDDTVRTGRFRRGNPNLGFEEATQYELSLRVRTAEHTSLRLGVYVRRLDGLVASVPLGLDPDSTIFGNADAGSVRGLEAIFDRELTAGVGARVAYTFQDAKATATSAFLLNRLLSIDPQTGDTIRPARAEFPLDFDRRHTVTATLRARIAPAVGPRLAGARPIGGLEAAAIARLASGLPYSRTDASGDSLIGLPNDSRLPTAWTLDVLVRRPLRLGGTRGGLYVDVRNLLDRRNVVAVRRDVGQPAPTNAIVEALAEEAYAANPESIPYESTRYRPDADLDGNGYVEGRDELFPLYLAAARDFSQPLFAYGPPRLVRLGVELVF